MLIVDTFTPSLSTTATPLRTLFILIIHPVISLPLLWLRGKKWTDRAAQRAKWTCGEPHPHAASLPQTTLSFQHSAPAEQGRQSCCRWRRSCCSKAESRKQDKAIRQSSCSNRWASNSPPHTAAQPCIYGHSVGLGLNQASLFSPRPLRFEPAGIPAAQSDNRRELQCKLLQQSSGRGSNKGFYMHL